MNVTVEHKIEADVVALFYDVYVRAFGPVRIRAAARHLLTMDEFAAEMLDERIDKYVVWGDGGRPVGLTILTTDLCTVPWISKDFYAHRYPDQAARGAIFYLGYTLVHPDFERAGVTISIMDRIMRRIRRSGGVCVFDVSANNDAENGIGAAMAGAAEWHPMDLVTVDQQIYYAAIFKNPATPVAVGSQAREA